LSLITKKETSSKTAGRRSKLTRASISKKRRIIEPSFSGKHLRIQMNLPIREQRKETNQQQKKAFHLVAAADFHEAPARSGDLNRGGEDLDAGLSWDRWKIREGEEDGG